MFDLTGRTCLITGASSGFGAHFARLLSGAGARLVLGARRKDRLDALVAEIAASGGEALAVDMDVTDEASTIAAYDAAEARLSIRSSPLPGPPHRAARPMFRQTTCGA